MKFKYFSSLKTRTRMIQIDPPSYSLIEDPAIKAMTTIMHTPLGVSMCAFVDACAHTQNTLTAEDSLCD